MILSGASGMEALRKVNTVERNAHPRTTKGKLKECSCEASVWPQSGEG